MISRPSMTARLASVLAVMLMAAAPAAAFAQDAAAPEAASPEAASPEATARAPWLVACSNQADPESLVCEMSQSIVLTQGNQRVATASFVKTAGQPAVTGVFALPFGISLADGLAFSVDGRGVGQMSFQTCDAQGCYASGPVDAAWIDAMRAGKAMEIAVNRQDGQEIRFSFQMTGFTKTLALLP